MNRTEPDASERRRYFRIDDQVALGYTVLEEGEVASAVERLQSGSPDKLGLASAFATATAQMKHSLEKFRREQPDIASYLDSLNEKIDLLAQHLAAAETDLGARTPQGVSLSASGLSFVANEALALGTWLEVKMLLFPSHHCVVALGKVLHCTPAEEGRPTTRHAIGVDFAHIRENDRELIVRHVTQRQSTMLREARLALEDQDWS